MKRINKIEELEKRVQKFKKAEYLSETSLAEGIPIMLDLQLETLKTLKKRK